MRTSIRYLTLFVICALLTTGCATCELGDMLAVDDDDYLAIPASSPFPEQSSDDKLSISEVEMSYDESDAKMSFRIEARFKPYEVRPRMAHVLVDGQHYVANLTPTEEVEAQNFGAFDKQFEPFECADCSQPCMDACGGIVCDDKQMESAIEVGCATSCTQYFNHARIGELYRTETEFVGDIIHGFSEQIDGETVEFPGVIDLVPPSANCSSTIPEDLEDDIVPLPNVTVGPLSSAPVVTESYEVPVSVTYETSGGKRASSLGCVCPGRDCRCD